MPFCKVPWLHADLGSTGKYRLCCFSDKSVEYSSYEEYWNSSYIQNVRKQFLDNKFPEECKKCKLYEENNITSLRQIFDQNFSDSKYSYTDISNIDFTKTTVTNYPVSFEVFLDNTCNFSCIMCNETSSSKIASEKLAINKSLGYNYYTIEKSNRTKELDIEFLIKSNPKHVKFLGGEPFYNKKFLTILERLDKNCVLEIVTNGSTLTDKHLNQLSQFRELRIQMSLDAIGKRLEDIRYGANWEIIEENFKIFKNLDNTWVGLNSVLFNMSLEGFPELYKWAKDNETIVSVIILKNPKHLSIASVPDQIRKQVSNQIKELDLHVHAEDSNLIKLFEDNAKNANNTSKYIENVEFDSNLNYQYKNHLKLLGNHRKINYLEIFNHHFL